MTAIDEHTLSIDDRDMILSRNGSETLSPEYRLMLLFNIVDQHLISAFTDHTLLAEHETPSKSVDLALITNR